MYKDPFTGLYHTHFRDYDPIHNRWLSEDPSGYADGLNLYASYIGMDFRDPLGLEALSDDMLEEILGKLQNIADDVMSMTHPSDLRSKANIGSWYHTQYQLAVEKLPEKYLKFIMVEQSINSA
ncbi:Peptidase C39, bacteriocin processing [Lentisphaera araneosa HTCC2155]|uniref:Peptidase C39, bacteriocin processing n=2 Tax=Lentisphaera TaxID=256846 RepID=A6DMN3_9BACT|nr:Peptidase C39, bacteriocin processing [Lentisphaera araneosa HTCC2155]